MRDSALSPRPAEAELQQRLACCCCWDSGVGTLLLLTAPREQRRWDIAAVRGRLRGRDSGTRGRRAQSSGDGASAVRGSAGLSARFQLPQAWKPQVSAPRRRSHRKCGPTQDQQRSPLTETPERAPGARPALSWATDWCS